MTTNLINFIVLLSFQGYNYFVIELLSVSESIVLVSNLRSLYDQSLVNVSPVSRRCSSPVAGTSRINGFRPDFCDISYNLQLRNVFHVCNIRLFENITPRAGDMLYRPIVINAFPSAWNHRNIKRKTGRMKKQGRKRKIKQQFSEAEDQIVI